MKYSEISQSVNTTAHCPITVMSALLSIMPRNLF